MLDKVEFSVLSDGRILDLRPMYSNNPPLVFKEGSWVAFDGLPGDIVDSQPIDKERVKDIISSAYLS